MYMCFDTMEEGKKFYTDYGIRSGFSVRIRTSKKNENKELNYLKLAYSREGKYVTYITSKLKTLLSQTKECPAGLTIARKEGK
ncbi:hypothetical protein LR48_Vigan10g023600 [Vigna angularis]|uniref:FAR1 domain-containing protein n=1 Tax=Phaseolus angularis TaxID=3914 RepID=A0A0L9VI04_PHAAN|nr:hypothetical protein LR48_Vigan10g023600 [Vigna angularis]